MISTTISRSVNAVSFKNANLDDIWVVFCKSDAWMDDTNPPTPSLSQTVPLEPICAQKGIPYLMIENDTDGAYQFILNSDTKKFDTDDSDSDFITNLGTIVMLYASASGEDIIDLADTYRQVCFVTGLVPASGHEDDTFLADANVSSYGTTLAVQNYRPTPVVDAHTYIPKALLQY